MASSDDKVIAGIREINFAYKKLLRINPKQNPGFVIRHLTRVFGSNDEIVIEPDGKEDDDDSIIGRIKTIFEVFHTVNKFDPEEASEILIGNLDQILSQGQAIEPIQSELRIESVITVEDEAKISPKWNLTTSTSPPPPQDEFESEEKSLIDDEPSPPVLEPEVELNSVQLSMNPVVQLILPGLRLKCPVCKSKCFSSPEILNYHIQAHAEENMERQTTMMSKPRKQHVCPICFKKCRVPSTLRDHIRTHTKSKPFICPLCHSCFSQKGSCKHHIFHKHKSILDPLIEAEEEFSDSPHVSLLGRNKRTTAPRTPRSLRTRRAARKINKTSHVNLKTNMRQKRPTLSYSKLTASIRNTKKKFKTVPPSRQEKECVYCQRKFQGTTNLKVHLRIHTGEKPYVCMYCNKRFNQKGACKVHIERHERPFPCEYCTRAFTTLTSRDSHVKLCHPVMVLSKDNETNQAS